MAFKSVRSQTFYGAVENVLNNWTALQLAVEHQLAGSESRAIAYWMIGTVENFFYENDDSLQGWEVGEFLGEILENEFNTECEDGSLEEIGNLLCKLFEMAKNGREDELKEELQKLPRCNLDLCKPLAPQAPPTSKIEDPMSNLSLTSEDQEQSTKSKNEPDEDGWVTVTKKK